MPSFSAFRRPVTQAFITGTAMVGLVEITTHLPSQGRSSEFYHYISDEVMTPLLRSYLNPENAHNVAIFFAKAGLSPSYRRDTLLATDLSTEVLGIMFSNPIGLAAGFDKNGEAIPSLQRMGFGSVEIGSVTPLPQPGNPKPRMFRLVEEGGIINRYGFNSKGITAVSRTLKAYKEKKEEGEPSLLSSYFSSTSPSKQIVGINLGKNKMSEISEIDDYCQGIRELGPYANYLVINVSSPNTPGLRDLQVPSSLKELVMPCLKERDKLPRKIPLLVKLAPDLTDVELREIADTLMACKIDGLIVSNTTNRRPASVCTSQHVNETGGLSGRPLKERSTECIRILYKHTKGKIPIIGVGGVSSADDVMEKLKAGASLVQIYSILAYEGAGIVTRIRHDLARLLREEKFKTIEEVVGYDHKEIYWKKRRKQLLKEENSMK